MKDGKLTSRERLFFETALADVIRDDVSPKGGRLRSIEDEKLLCAYQNEGVKSTVAMIDGKKCGSYTVVETKERHETQLSVADPDALLRWAGENGLTKTVVDEEGVMRLFRETGEVPDGCEAVEVTVPAKLRTSLRIDPEKVRRAIGDVLPGQVAGLLG